MIEFDYIQDNMEVIHKISEMPIFEPFEKKDLQGLLRVSASKLRKYKQGELIIEEGAYDDVIFFLVSGKVKISKQGKELYVVKRRGDVFGEMGVIAGATRSASAYAMEETSCLIIDTTSINKLAGNNKLAYGYVLYRILGEILADRLRITSEELIKSKDEIALLKKSINKE